MIKLKLIRIIKVIVFLLVVVVSSKLLISIFDERFDKAKWHNKPLERYQMVHDIIESRLLIGKTKGDIISLLGQPNSVVSKPKRGFVYKLGTEPSFFNTEEEVKMLVIFQNEKVSKVTEAID
ncbi:hypothetical protein [uncultured Winogradskyella sp.]|uniref:hypothetical protein n=1 Tax=uncultured Winogradskyella sp. TaxID=395353 RepID=UPI0026300CD2|nr:hypothetical protein [uncultured Winogradskyella sp.]